MNKKESVFNVEHPKDECIKLFFPVSGLSSGMESHGHSVKSKSN